MNQLDLKTRSKTTAVKDAMMMTTTTSLLRMGLVHTVQSAIGGASESSSLK